MHDPGQVIVKVGHEHADKLRSTYQHAKDRPYATGSIFSWLDDLECRRQWHALSTGIHKMGGADMLLVVRVDLIQIILLDWIFG